MNQPVRTLAFRPPRSVPAAPESAAPTFQWERFSAIARELPPLFQRHWEELGTDGAKVPLEPNWPLFYDHDLLGLLRILTVRSKGQLVGYMFCFVGPHMHHASTLWGHVDSFWLDPAYRQGWTGVRLFREMVAGLKAWGVKVIYVGENLAFEQDRGGLGRILKRLGFKPRDLMYSLYVGA